MFDIVSDFFFIVGFIYEVIGIFGGCAFLVLLVVLLRSDNWDDFIHRLGF